MRKTARILHQRINTIDSDRLNIAVVGDRTSENYVIFEKCVNHSLAEALGRNATSYS